MCVTCIGSGECPALAGKRPFAGPGCINLSLLCHLNGIVSSIPR